MTAFGITITGDRSAILRFEQFPAHLHDRLYAALTQIEQRLETAVVASEPSKTGALRGMTGGRVYDHGDRIAAVVGVRATDEFSALKAMALEYGSHKSITVRAHKAKLNHLWSRAFGPIMVDVKEHARTTNIQAMEFLRGPLAAVRSDAMAQLQAALDGAVEDSE